MTAPTTCGLPSLPEPILVLGAYGYRNVGDEAILAGLLTALGPDRRVTVVSRRPGETTAMHGVAAVGMARLPVAMVRHRSLLVGGGGLFGGGMGRLGRLTGLAALAARAAGKAVAIVGVGVDPGLPRVASAPLRLVAPHLVGFSVRDAASANVLARHGMAAEVGDDLSELLAPAPASEGRAVLVRAGVDPRRPVVGLALTALGDPGTTAYAMAGTLRTIAADLPGVQLCCIPMSQHPYVAWDNDLLLARQLQRQVPGLTVVDEVHHPAVILSVVGRLSAMVAMRYHAMRFAHRMETPLLAIPYAPKCVAWLEDHGVRAVRLESDAVAAGLRAILHEPLSWTA